MICQRRPLLFIDHGFPPRFLQIHLSHNSIGLAGTRAILEAVPIDEDEVFEILPQFDRSKGAGNKPLWLRLEWNVVPYEGVLELLDELEKTRGLVADIPNTVNRARRGYV